MNIKIMNFAFFFAIMAITSVLLSAENEWWKEFEKEGITVYTRPIEGSSLKEFKGEGVINASLEVCFNVVADVESQTKWRPDCISARLIKRNGNIVFSYNETKAPWPVSNRDAIVKSEVIKSQDKIVINFIGVDDPELVPLKNNVVRMTDIKGIWMFVRKGDETHVTFQARINPGGSLPAWLANRTAVDQPFKSLMGMREMVKDPKYQNK